MVINKGDIYRLNIDYLVCKKIGDRDLNGWGIDTYNLCDKHGNALSPIYNKKGWIIDYMVRIVSTERHGDMQYIGSLK